MRYRKYNRRKDALKYVSLLENITTSEELQKRKIEEIRKKLNDPKYMKTAIEKISDILLNKVFVEIEGIDLEDDERIIF